MIEHVEELPINAQLHMLRQLKPLGKIQVAPDEIGAAQRISAEVAKLTIRRAVTARTSAGTWIDRGDESIRVEPLDGAGLRDPRDRSVFVYGHAGDNARILRTGCSWMMPFPFAEYGALKTENGKPLCQNAVPETCHPFSARASSGLRAFIGN